MRLDEFRQEEIGQFVRYSAPVVDTAGKQVCELLILGSDTLIRESFTDTDFQVTFRPGAHKSIDELIRERPEVSLGELATKT